MAVYGTKQEMRSRDIPSSLRLFYQHWLCGKHLNAILKARLPPGSDTYTLVLRSTEDIRCFQRSAYHRPAIP